MDRQKINRVSAIAPIVIGRARVLSIKGALAEAPAPSPPTPSPPASRVAAPPPTSAA